MRNGEEVQSRIGCGVIGGALDGIWCCYGSVVKVGVVDIGSVEVHVEYLVWKLEWWYSLGIV